MVEEYLLKFLKRPNIACSMVTITYVIGFHSYGQTFLSQRKSFYASSKRQDELMRRYLVAMTEIKMPKTDCFFKNTELCTPVLSKN